MNIFSFAAAGAICHRGQDDPDHRLAAQQIILRFQKRLLMNINAD
ncbi:hypothetical protein [Caballeronia sp. dw_19]|nr:hypothetical protein [Caballeronia sp. dw_19]